MLGLFNIIASAQQQDTTAAPDAFESFWNPAFIVLIAIGLFVFLNWLLSFGGFGALQKAPTRRHRWGFVLWPVIILLSWQICATIFLTIIARMKGMEIRSLPEAVAYPVNAVIEIGLIAVMLLIVHKSFVRGITGFGLNVRTIYKDFGFSVVHLLAVLPFIYCMLVIVLTIGRLIKSGYAVPEHQTLTFLSDNDSVITKTVVILTASLIVPVFEEMLFRGFLQSAIRSATSPWIAIIVTSAFFALIHYPNYTHMPALFFLSCGFGYAYERSGSLFRPIWMHILFNGFNITATLIQSG